MCKHLGQCLTLDRHSVQRPVCYFQWKTGLCQTLELRTEHQGIPVWSVCLHFGNWAKEAVLCSALITGMPPPCPDSSGLGIWKREVSTDGRSGQKILSWCAAAELIQTLAPILRVLSEVELVICSVCMSFSGHWLWGLLFYHHCTVVRNDVAITWGSSDILWYFTTDTSTKYIWWMWAHLSTLWLLLWETAEPSWDPRHRLIEWLFAFAINVLIGAHWSGCFVKSDCE